MIRISTYLLLILMLPLLSAAQDTEDSTSTDVLAVPGEQYHLGLFPKQEPPALKSFGVSGFYRFFGTYTDMRELYPLVDNGLNYTPDRSLFIADDSQLPNLWMNIAGRPSKNTSFNMDFFMFQFLNGQVNDSYGVPTLDSLRPAVYDPLSSARLGGNLGLNLGINLRGTYATSLGSFAASMGGTHWYNLSDLTFASFRGYNRFTLFERNPWDPIEKDPTDRYRKFHQEGAIQQDLRWGSRAFHGLILEGTDLPKNLAFSLLYGRTEQNGGLSTQPNLSIGGRIRHESKNGWESYNTFNSRNYSDSLNQSSVGFNVHTLEIDKTINGFGVHAEIGAGRYYSPTYTESWGEAINLKLKLPKALANMPIEVHYYRIAPEVINNNAQFWNTSIQEANTNTAVAGSAGVLVPFASSMTVIGAMTNNRTGLNINAEKSLSKKFNVSVGYGLSSEIDAISNSITFSHTVNQLTRSRFWRWNFVPDVGPYDRYSVVYRDAYETVNLSDDSLGVVINRKHFATAEFQAKYSSKLFNRDLYIFYLGRMATVQPEFKVLLPTNEDAYIRHYSSEFELYYALTPTFFLAQYFGYERILGNYYTDIDVESRRPRNQEGVGYGAGFELSLGKNSVFILRHRIFAFQDFSFERDQFKGSESLAEIKVFF